MGHTTPVEARLLGGELLPHGFEIQLLLAEPLPRVGTSRVDLPHLVPRFDQPIGFSQGRQDRLQSALGFGELEVGVLQKV